MSVVNDGRTMDPAWNPQAARLSGRQQLTAADANTHVHTIEDQRCSHVTRIPLARHRAMSMYITSHWVATLHGTCHIDICTMQACSSPANPQPWPARWLEAHMQHQGQPSASAHSAPSAGACTHCCTASPAANVKQVTAKEQAKSTQPRHPTLSLELFAHHPSTSSHNRNHACQSIKTR